MKNVKRIFTLKGYQFLSLFFILFFKTYSFGQECNSGLTYSPFLNRCLSTESAARVRQSESQCSKKATASERNKCFEDAAKNEFQKKEASGEVKQGVGRGSFVGNKTWSLLLNGLALTASGLSWYSTAQSGDCPGANSLKILSVGSGIAAMGEIWTSIEYGRKLKKMNDRFKTLEEQAKAANNGKAAPTDIQAEAFQVMADQQNMIATVAKSKRGWYQAAFTALTVGALVGVYESMQTITIPYFCRSLVAEHEIITPQPDFLFSPPQEMYAFTNALEILFPTAFAQDYTRAWDAQKNPKAAACQCGVKPTATATQMTFDYRTCEFTSQQLAICKGIGIDAGVITRAGKSFIGSRIVSQTNAESLLSRQKCAQYVDLKQCPVIAGIATQEATVQAAEPILRSTLTKMAPSLSSLPLLNMPLAITSIPGVDVILAPIKELVTNTAAPVYNGMFKYLATPMGRVTISGLMALYAKATMDHYAKQEAVARERAQFILGLKEQVTASGAAFSCTQGRNNSAQPECYCYNDDGSVNASRARTQTCQRSLVAAQKKASAATSEGTNATPVCLKQGVVDEKCECQKNQTCSSLSFNRAIGSPALTAVINEALKPGNALLSGKITGTQMSSLDQSKNLAALQKLKDNLLAKNPKLQQKVLGSQNQLLKIDDAVTRKISKQFPQYQGGFSPLSSGAPGIPSENELRNLASVKNPQNFLEKAQESLLYGGSEKNGNSEKTLLDQTDGDSQGGVILDESAQLAQLADLDMKNIDINQESDQNLFEILSRRYLASGVKRLFKD